MSDANHQGATPGDSNIPADQGLSTLGLLMQLIGTLGSILALMMVIMFVAVGGYMTSRGIMAILLLTCIVRSVFHRMAGTQLLYGRNTLDGPESPIAGIRRYIVAAVLQTIAIALILNFKLHATAKMTVAMSLGLLAWPVLLGVVFRLPRFKKFETGLPIGEDKGLEGLSIVMTMFGMIGALMMGAVLVMMLRAGGEIVKHGAGILLVISVVMLLIRSIMHARAGLTGLRETNLSRMLQVSNEYGSFGVIAAFAAAGSLLIIIMTEGPNFAGFALAAVLCWALLAWPLIVRRFISERQFSDYMADGAMVHQRAPDAGLTGLGWLLIGSAMASATVLVPQLVAGRDVWTPQMYRFIAVLGPMQSHSLWWGAVTTALQLWAGFELVRMSPVRRIAASAYAVIVGVISIWQLIPLVSLLKHSMRGASADMMSVFLPFVGALFVPIATLILVNRSTAPTARARFRTPPPPTPAP